MRLRYWVLGLADVMVVVHIIFLILIVIHSSKENEIQFKWMLSSKVPVPVYTVTNLMPIVISSFLYMGIFRLSSRLLFTWLTAMVLLWHIPAILVFYILCLDKDEANTRKQRIIAPCLWLCIWMLLMINVFTFYSELRKFKKHPQFLRTNVILVKKMTNLAKLKADNPGKLLVAIDSET